MEKVEKIEKKKIDKTRVATKAMALFLALLMVVGTVTTCVYYLVNYVIKK